MIGLTCFDREILYGRINRRVDKMLEEGLVEEARGVYENYHLKTAFNAIGYKELLAVGENGEGLAAALEEVKLRSRQYAKRQLTWLRRNGDIHWITWGNKRDFARALQVSTEILAAAGVS